MLGLAVCESACCVFVLSSRTVLLSASQCNLSYSPGLLFKGTNTHSHRYKHTHTRFCVSECNLSSSCQSPLSVGIIKEQLITHNPLWARCLLCWSGQNMCVCAYLCVKVYHYFWQPPLLFPPPSPPFLSCTVQSL